ncbi:hypothetical protein [Polyangium sorediatum]|uniref:Tox-REase-9 domain-containing protein n=1 Tax=Polyangium sorediatum TaxID=889274 RepID=A0ABT6PAJ2_9BACT|nr:hypothetical protein [Polyangium sorediatum]MDI1437654.1 hypothetical protein [Polyangium sorediatum]
MAWLSNRFVRLWLLVLVALGVSVWLLGCAATGANTQAWAQTTPNGMRLFRICRRHPHVDPNARYWYDVGDGTPRTTFLSLDELLESREAKAVYIHDANAPSESRKLLGIAFQHLPCDKPPPPPPEKKLAAKEKEDGEQKDEAHRAEPPKSRPKLLPRPIARPPERERCTAYREPGQTRQRRGTGSRTCTRILVKRPGGEPAVAENRPRPVEAPAPKDPSEVQPGEVWRYEEWSQTPEETARLERAYECLAGVCHARHQNFQPKGGKKPAGKHHGQSLSTGSGSGGGAGAPQPAPKSTVKTRTKPVGKPNGGKPNGGAAGQAGNGSAADPPPQAKPKRGGENPAAARGREVHKEFTKKVEAKQGEGWVPEPIVRTTDGRILKPDALTPRGNPIELKPNTPTGKAAGKHQMKKYEDATQKRGRVIYYDP